MGGYLWRIIVKTCHQHIESVATCRDYQLIKAFLTEMINIKIHLLSYKYEIAFVS